MTFWSRFLAVFIKEFVQMRRDRITFAMMVGVPLMQLILFGYAINSDPKALPTAVVMGENTTFARSIVTALQNSAYFKMDGPPVSEAEADKLLRLGEVQFVVTIPVDFTRDVLRGRRPTLLVEADATDPAATSNAIAALISLNQTALDHDLTGPLAEVKTAPAPFNLQIHRRYNEEGITQFNIVPGLMGVVLTMTMVMMTGLAMTREQERGTMENLLAMPIRPLEVMLGKIAPYIFVGYVQVAIIILAAHLLFQVPVLGSLPLLMGAAIFFIAANLAVGFTFSTLAKSQMQAMQLSFFYFLPSLLLSGFMFPFRGMPIWAQWIGEVLPLTHFLRIIRGIMLKGNVPAEVWPNLWPIAAFMLVAMGLALLRYRRTVA
ncbi:MAG TPA: ABC transporter permease [Alphaproteobacteria bacterium]|nr:ABC transporter permease [Alphaproteobacteria bacterium]